MLTALDPTLFLSVSPCLFVCFFFLFSKAVLSVGVVLLSPYITVIQVNSISPEDTIKLETQALFSTDEPPTDPSNDGCVVPESRVRSGWDYIDVPTKQSVEQTFSGTIYNMHHFRTTSLDGSPNRDPDCLPVLSDVMWFVAWYCCTSRTMKKSTFSFL